MLMLSNANTKQCWCKAVLMLCKAITKIKNIELVDRTGGGTGRG